MVPAQELVDGRIALVGDAGYCPTFMSGMGAAAALQDAYCLAAQVDRHADPMDALRQYEQKILPIDLRTLFMQAARVILLRPASWPKIASGTGSLALLSACILTFWLRHSPTSWRVSRGRCWHKSAAMKHASRRPQPEGTAASSPRAWLKAQAEPESNS